ncbi:hypothetical protein ACQVP2_07675 [Methylobacterium aquaticum]|uniref:hypothetical protein n=1 Tax=Methylobacterium aquaticum TaxID=270351 RepID=UPI003D175AB7
MLVSAHLPAAARGASPAVQAAAVATRVTFARKSRAIRRAFMLGFVSDPGLFDAIIPGLSRLDPGPRNDLLREFMRDPARQLRHDPRRLQAALVVARRACWLALHR